MNLQEKKLFLLDMDGTLYLDEKLFDGAKDFLCAARALGARCLFLTNNSSRGVSSYVAKLSRLGIDATAEDFLSSVDATIRYIEENKLENERFYLCGTASLCAQLSAAGICVTGREEATALLCGFDTELTFGKIEDACILLNRGVPFLATNPDWVCPTEYGYVPDCGSVCEMLTRATGRHPIVIGKPEPRMALLAMERTGCTAGQTLLIGDRLYTDIACGARAGVDTALVLSGESTMDDVARAEVKPTVIYRDIRKIYLEMQRLLPKNGGETHEAQ